MIKNGKLTADLTRKQAVFSLSLDYTHFFELNLCLTGLLYNQIWLRDILQRPTTS